MLPKIRDEILVLRWRGAAIRICSADPSSWPAPVG